MIRIDINGEVMRGYVTLSCKTKHPSHDQRIVTKNQKISIENMPVRDFEDVFVGQFTVRYQKIIRDLDVPEARSFAGKTDLDYKDILVGRKRRKTVIKVLSPDEMLEMAKENPEYKRKMMETLKKMTEMD